VGVFFGVSGAVGGGILDLVGMDDQARLRQLARAGESLIMDKEAGVLSVITLDARYVAIAPWTP
jgi:hypothetical protein